MARVAKPDDAARLAEGMLVALQAWPDAGWPPTATEVAHKIDPRVSAKAVLSALRRKALAAVALPVRMEPESPIALMADAPRLAAAPATLEFVLRSKRTRSLHLFTVAQLKEKVTSRGRLKELFAAAVNEQIGAGRVPATVAWVLDRRPKLFLLENLNVAAGALGGGFPSGGPSCSPGPALPEPGGAAEPAVPFDVRFDEVFRRLDRQAGSHNFVSLVALRRALAEFAREEFDRSLDALRRAGHYGLSAAESYSGISAEQREAGIVEAGSLLLYVSRKSP